MQTLACGAERLADVLLCACGEAGAALQVLIGGGQEASQVTTTGARSGNFQSRFFHKVRC